MSDPVTLLLQNFHQNRRDYGRRLAEMLEKDPASFRQAAVKYLSGEGKLPSEQIVVWLLQKAGMLVSTLLDPNLCSLEDAARVARAVKRNADRVDVELARILKDSHDAQAERILRLLAEIADNNRTLPLLTSVLREARSELRSMAAMIFARHCQNTLFIENAMRDRDPSVRASAIEGLGLASRGTSEPAILLEALYDPSPRVRANAALARYRFGDKGSLRLLTEIAGMRDPEARRIAAWAMGQTLDVRCLTLLENLRSDPDPQVQVAVEGALTRVRVNQGATEAATPNQPVHFDVLSASIDTHGNRSFYVVLTATDGSEVIDLIQHHFSAQEDGAAVTNSRVQTPANRDPMHLAFVLDCSASIKADETQAINFAVVRSLQEKLPKDKVAVYKFSMDVERSVGLTESLSALTSVVRRRYSGLKTASRLHDAVCLAVEELTRHRGFRAVVAIADGSDRGSDRNLTATAQYVKQAGIPLFMIGFGSEVETAGPKELALQTGGSFSLVPNSQALAAECRKLVRRFSSHYAFSYTRPGPPPKAFRIQVSAPVGRGEVSLAPPPVASALGTPGAEADSVYLETGRGA